MDERVSSEVRSALFTDSIASISSYNNSRVLAHDSHISCVYSAIHKLCCRFDSSMENMMWDEHGCDEVFRIEFSLPREEFPKKYQCRKSNLAFIQLHIV